MSDPLTELKRQIEREQYRSKIEIELERDYAVRGDRISGQVVVSAGPTGLDAVDLEVKIEHLSLSAQSSCLAKNLIMVPGDVLRFAFWLDVPADAPCEERRLIASAGMCRGLQSFRIDPEEPFGSVTRALADGVGLEIASWSEGRGGDGWFGQLRPTPSDAPMRGSVGVELRVRPHALQGTLIIDPPCPTAVDVLRSLIRPSRRRIPFSILLEERDSAGETLLALLLSHLRREQELPIPAHTQRECAENLPVPSTSEVHR